MAEANTAPSAEKTPAVPRGIVRLLGLALLAGEP